MDIKEEILQKLKQRKLGANVVSTLKDYKDLIEHATSWMGKRPFSEKVVAFLLGLHDWPKCRVCGKPIINKHFNLKALLNPEEAKKNGIYPIPKYCSPSCQMKDKEIQKIYREKYWSNKEKQKQKVEKIKATNLKKYGVENVSQVKEIQHKKLETLKKSMGITSWSEFASYAVKKKYEKYGYIGYDNPQQLQKAIQAMKEKFGGIPFQNKEFLQKALQKALTPEKIRERTEKMKETYKKKSIEKIKKYAKHTHFELVNFSKFENYVTLKCKNCGHVFQAKLYGAKHILHIRCPNCELYKSKLEEKFEEEVLKPLNIEYIPQYKIRGRDGKFRIVCDFYIPSQNLIIEINGNYWHSEASPNNSKRDIEKFETLTQMGYQVIMFYEDELYEKKKIIIDILKRRLGLIQHKIYARNCIIKQIPKSEEKKFLDEYHLQGYALSSVAYGLYYNKELVAVMSFVKNRANINTTGWELLRFATKAGINIVGGFQKLLTHFLKEYKPQVLHSYIDRRVFTGKSYLEFGFVVVNIQKETFYWVKDIYRVNRFTFPGNTGYKEGFVKLFLPGPMKVVYKQ